jgi:hypothetical protein
VEAVGGSEERAMTEAKWLASWHTGEMPTVTL